MCKCIDVTVNVIVDMKNHCKLKRSYCECIYMYVRISVHLNTADRTTCPTQFNTVTLHNLTFSK